MARFGMNRRKEDDVVATSGVEGGVSASDAIDAQLAQTDMDELTALNDDLIEFSQAADNLGELQSAHDVQVKVMDGSLDPTTGRVEDDVNISVDAKTAGEIAGPEGELLGQDASDADAEAAAVKLEHDIQAILTPLNGTYRSSRYGASSVLSRTQENALNGLTGKQKYRRMAEGIADVAKKVWEYIKDFFKKIWAKIKDLASRFMGLFRSNKSVLENLKKDIEADESANYETCDKEKVGQALRILCKDPYVDSSVYTSAFDRIQEMATAIVEGLENEKIDQKAFSDLIDKTLKPDFNPQEIESPAKNAKYSLMGVSNEGYLLVELQIGSGNDGINSFSANIVTKKMKKEEFSKISDKKTCLLDMCDNGIQLCEALESDSFKDLDKTMKTFEKDVDKLLKEATDKGKEKIKEANIPSPAGEVVSNVYGEVVRMIQKIVPKAATILVQSVVSLSKTPSAYIAGVRNGKSICHKK